MYQNLWSRDGKFEVLKVAEKTRRYSRPPTLHLEPCAVYRISYIISLFYAIAYDMIC
jgi:hypothetical protein